MLGKGSASLATKTSATARVMGWKCGGVLEPRPLWASYVVHDHVWITLYNYMDSKMFMVIYKRVVRIMISHPVVNEDSQDCSL